MGWMWIWWGLGIALIAAVVAMIARNARGSDSGTGPGRETPEQLLKRRYANGEVDRDEYQRTLDDLRR